MTVTKKYAKYVSQNILGMVGVSLYILADTFFISVSEGADGITALNLVLPVYSIIYALGAMLGVGSAIRFQILRARGEKEAEQYFSNAMCSAFLLSIPFMFVGAVFPGELIALLGGDAGIVRAGISYTRIFMVGAPWFMWNTICPAFVRNDDDPSLAMTATIGGSLFNIVMDYVLMFPMKMGMTGAALATVLSAVVGVLLSGIHFFTKKNTIPLKWYPIPLKRMLRCCQLGISAFVGEISSGVITMVYNLLLLNLAGNVAVAAYGVIANISIVVTAVFNGIAQGSQPLFSELYGKRETEQTRKVLKLGVATAVVLAAASCAGICLYAEEITGIFNSEQNLEMARYAVSGMKLYFPGFFFAGINIVGTGYLSAVEAVKWASAASFLRGFAAITGCAVLFALLFGMTGVWLSFPAAELITMVVTIVGIMKSR